MDETKVVQVRDVAILHPETVTKAEDIIKERKAAKRKPRTKTDLSKITVMPEIWQKAMELAQGDTTRIKVESETSVLVKNPK